MMDAPNENDVIVEDTATDCMSYSGTWSKYTNPSFHGGSLHISYDDSASISFAFTGERFWYYSDMNIDHGNCSISLDGVIVQPSLSTYSANIQYAKALYSQAVDPGSHTVTVTNLSVQKAFTLDYFVFRPVSNDVPNSQDISLHPDDPSVTFTPATGAWARIHDAGQTPGYRETTQQGAYFSFTFEGEYVWFQWKRTYDHGVYSVSLDGGAPSLFSAYSPEITSLLILYSRKLTPGPHTLIFTNG